MTGITTSVAKVKLGNDIYVGGRVTATLAGPWRAHLKLGYTSLKTSTNITRTGFDEDDFPDGDFNLDTRLDGYRAGVGVLYSSDEDTTYYGAEYRYSDYERGVKWHQVGVVIGARF